MAPILSEVEQHRAVWDKASDSDQIWLAPLAIRPAGEHYYIYRSDTGTSIRTNAVGARAVELLQTGLSIGAVRASLGEGFGLPAEKVDLNPLIETLASNRFILQIGSESLQEISEKLQAGPHPLGSRIAGAVGTLAIKYLPLPPMLQLLYAWKPGRSHEVQKRIEENLARAGALGLSQPDRTTEAELNIDVVLRASLDRLLLAALSGQRLRRWFEDYMTVDGAENLDEAVTLGNPVVLCGFHTGSFSLLPYLLAARGYSITALIQTARDARQIAENTVLHLRDAGLCHDLELVYGPQGMRRLRKAPECGRLPLILPDAFLGESMTAQPVAFLGCRLRPSTGIAWLCQGHVTEIVPVFLSSNPEGHHCLHVEPPLHTGNEDTEEAILQKVYGALATAVGQAPHQWQRWSEFHSMIVQGKGNIEP